MSQEIAYPNAAIIHDGGTLLRKIIPGPGETAMFDLSGTESVLILHSPPYDDATCSAALAVIFGA